MSGGAGAAGGRAPQRTPSASPSSRDGPGDPNRTVLTGRYRLESFLGGGGMAHVYRGSDLVLRREVAIKVLAPQFTSDPRFVRRFRREARAAALLSHPNVVAVYDAGSDDGTHYIVMEYVEGRTLRDVLREEGKLASARAVQIGQAVCRGLHEAHRRGIVHRDIKPGNIIITPAGAVKVMDFGIARDVTSETLTQDPAILGTAAYLSPEQVRGARADPRSDLYALGCVLYEMLGGHAPFTGDTALAIAYKHVQEQPDPPSLLNPDVPRALETVVLKAMAKDPVDRYQSAEDLREELGRALLTAAEPKTEATMEMPSPTDETVPLQLPASGPGARTVPTGSAPPPHRPAGPGNRGRTRPRALTLSVRLVLTYALIVAATLLVVTGLAIHLTRTHLEGELDARLTAAVRSFREGPAPRVAQPSDLAAQARGWLAAQAFPEGQTAAVRTSSGEVLTSAGGIDLRDVRDGFDLLTSTQARWWEVQGPDGSIRAVTVPLLLDGRQVGTLVVAASRSRLNATLDALLSGIGWASGIGLLFASLLGLAAVRRTLRPLSRMSTNVEAIEATGDLSRRVAHEGPPDEVGRLAQAFDRMLASLEKAFRSQQRFLTDASHELRTPLTVARGRLELLEQQLRAEGARRSLSLAVDELDRMRRIVDDLLLLARLDEGLPLSAEPVEVELILREAVLRGLQLERREVRVEAEPGLEASADPDRLLQVVTNLVMNAIQHAGPGARITLASRTDGDRARIDVSDTGPGILEQDLPHVFERFYRGSQARAGAAGGAGLGLAIAASLGKAMGGQIGADSVAGKGTTFTLWLPKVGGPRPAPARSPLGTSGG